MVTSLSAMMATVDGGKARRNITTYGKAARRQISGYTSPTLIATSSVPDVCAWEDDGNPGYGEDTRSTSPGISVRTLASGSERASPRSAISMSPGRNRGHRGSGVDFRGIVSKPLERVNDQAITSSQGLYDVPSSADEQGPEQGLNCTSMRKRRKIERSTPGKSLDIVHDDASLQRDIAAKAVEADPHISAIEKAQSVERNRKYHGARVSKARKGSRKSSTIGEQPLSMARASHGTSTTPVKRPALPQLEAKHRVTLTKQRLTPEPKSHHQKVSKNIKALSPEFAKTSRLDQKKAVPRNSPLPSVELTTASTLGRIREPARQENDFPPVTRNARPRTPSPSRMSVPLNTTPRQRELWGMLLREEDRGPSPNRLDLTSLYLTPSKSAKRRSLDLFTRHSKNEVKNIVEQPRRRLVDKLHGKKVAHSRLDGGFGQEADISDTESEDTASQASSTDGSKDVATSLASGSQSTGLSTHVDLFQATSQPLSLLPGGGPKVTYARQRSYLTESDLSEVALFSTPLVQESDSWDGTRRRGMRPGAPTLKPILNVQDQVDEGDGAQSGTVRSIHELREAGGNARLASEMESLIDDLDEKAGLPLAVRRSGLLVLVVKLQEPTFCRRFIDHDLEHRLMAYAESNTDLVSNILLAASMLYLVARKRSVDAGHQVTEQGTVDFLIRLLDNDLDITSIAKDRRNNMSKVARMEFSELRRSLLEPSLWRNGPPPKVTARVLAMQCLEYMVRHAREKGSTIEFMSQSAITRMVELLVPAPSQPLPSTTASETFDLQLAISTLESCTISNSAMCDETPWTSESIERLTGLLPTIETSPESAEMLGSLRTLVLRLYLNITNNKPSLCEAFSRPEVIRSMFCIISSHFQSLTDDADEDQQALLLDNLILALGFLINLAEWSHKARRLVLFLEDDIDSPLETLMQLFQLKLQRAAEVSARSKRVRAALLTSAGRL